MTRMPATETPDVTVLQAMLAGEHAAVYAYGVLGGRLQTAPAMQLLAREGYLQHRNRRDDVITMVRTAGAEPVAAEVGYGLPVPVDDAVQARTLARHVEDRCSVLYADVVAAATGNMREYAIAALIDAATRALGWGAEATALPGVLRP